MVLEFWGQKKAQALNTKGFVIGMVSDLWFGTKVGMGHQALPGTGQGRERGRGLLVVTGICCLTPPDINVSSGPLTTLHFRKKSTYVNLLS